MPRLPLSPTQPNLIQHQVRSTRIRQEGFRVGELDGNGLNGARRFRGLTKAPMLGLASGFRQNRGNCGRHVPTPRIGDGETCRILGRHCFADRLGWTGETIYMAVASQATEKLGDLAGRSCGFRQHGAGGNRRDGFRRIRRDRLAVFVFAVFIGVRDRGRIAVVENQRPMALDDETVVHLVKMATRGCHRQTGRQGNKDVSR
jgi:hypothetical protein